jgi:hypothetical protein
MLAKVVKPARACREANYSKDTINIRDDSSNRTIETSRMSTAAGPPQSDSKKVSNSREDSLFSRGSNSSSKNSQLGH